LNNSADITFDAVLSDTGRYRLAKGDGSFKIAKYSFADDEIDYSKYNKSHASGSAYYDLDILKTPVLEAFTNNASTMKHKLLSIPRTNLLYLPVMLLNEAGGDNTGLTRNNLTTQANNMFAVAVDEDTEKQLAPHSGGDPSGGVIMGATNNLARFIQIDQGLNTTEISKNFSIDPDLRETRYLVEIDNRLGSITDPSGTPRTPSFIDDDSVATYNFSFGTDTPDMIDTITATTDAPSGTPIAGPRGTKLMFSIKASLELNSSTFLFTKLGLSGKTWATSNTTDQTFYFIDSMVRVTGATTGYRVDVPIRFVKKTPA